MDRSFNNGGQGNNDIVRNLVVGILVIIVLFFIFQSIRGGGSRSQPSSQVLRQILNVAQDNQTFLSFQKDLIEELTKANDKIKALDEFSIVIDQSIDFEGYGGYTGIPYNKDFRNNKFPV
jgi:hypothetical protein